MHLPPAQPSVWQWHLLHTETTYSRTIATVGAAGASLAGLGGRAHHASMGLFDGAAGALEPVGGEGLNFDRLHGPSLMLSLCHVAWPRKLS
jgi:hypothetical protein